MQAMVVLDSQFMKNKKG
jgi:hypothetical protein